MCLKFSNARRDRARKDDNGDTRPAGSSLAVRMIAEVIAYHTRAERCTLRASQFGEM